MLEKAIFSISSEGEFEKLALEVFRYQYEHTKVYREFCNYLKVEKSNIRHLSDIPFLPIQFFKSHSVIVGGRVAAKEFTSSGTTGSRTSSHFVADLHLYETSFTTAFKNFYGDPSQFAVLALLPSYLERDNSSLVYMVDRLIKKSKNPESGFYLNNISELVEQLLQLESKGQKALLIGVSYALLDLIEAHTFQLKNTLVMETGGMKGKRKELVKEELHTTLKKGFGLNTIHSEYGMTELLSQAYSEGNGIFSCPPWMKVIIRDTEDALTLLTEKAGGINIIDLANLYSCSFIATQDLGKVQANGNFEILGRFDTSDIRGCNLMVV